MTTDDPIDTFLEQRELLFAIAYNMLGTVTDTEDVLQDAWLAWSERQRSATAEPVRHPRAYLVRVVTHLALDRCTAVRRARETYVGPWLPEPLVTVEDAADAVERKESLTMAVLVLLETLSPLERVAFVLHDVFGYQHTEIAEILGRTPAAVRQLASRARAHLHDRPLRNARPPGAGTEIAQRLIAAARGGDLPTLLSALAPEVTLWTDSGGRGVARNLEPVHGRERVAALLLDIAADPSPAATSLTFRSVAGEPCAVIFAGRQPFAVVVVESDPDTGRVTGIYSITNPDKLSGARGVSA